MIDYGSFYKSRYRAGDLTAFDRKWDVFISAYNDSKRVRDVFEHATATEKHWILLPDYGYTEAELPATGTTYRFTVANEAESLLSYCGGVDVAWPDVSICVDITGFMRPHLMFLLRYLHHLGVRQFDVLYSDPDQYVAKEKTQFSGGVVTEVRQVAGFEGDHGANSANDVLIIGAGFDHKLIAQVAEAKARSSKYQVFGLPSLQPDMYQQNVLRASLAEDSVGVGARDRNRNFFASANDPFETAEVLRRIVAGIEKAGAISNLYLSPLGTKPQALGFALYYILECAGRPASIIFPFAAAYSRETSVGFSRLSKYTIELPERP